MSDMQVFMRAIPAMLEQKDDRTLTGRLVPYDTVAWVLDELPNGERDIYQEGFRRSAFGEQVDVSTRHKGVLTKIGLIHKHEGGLGYLGPFIALRDEPDGLWGDALVMPTQAENVGALLRAGVDELSVEFRLRPGDNTQTDASGVRWRTRAHLDQVALEPKGAYRGAQVLAYRAELDDLERARAEQDAADAEAEDQASKDRAELEEAEAVLEAQRQRRAEWDMLIGRLPDAQALQERIVKDYGVTKFGRPIRDS